MSRLPEGILENIFLRLKVKHLLRCRCVCKAWRDLICSPSFIYKHLNISIQDNNCIMFLYWEDHKSYLFYTIDYNLLMSSLASSPAETYECYEAVRILNSTDYTVRILGSYNGLLCVYSSDSPDDVAVITIWNPSSNEYKLLPRPSKKAYYDIDYYGFGYDYKNDDYKVVRIVDYFLETRAKSDVEVYSLRSDSWKNIDAIPYYFPSIHNCGVIVNGAIHWIGVGIDNSKDTIVAFDISEETFKDLGVIEGPMIQPPEIYDEENNNNLGVLGGLLCLLYKEFEVRVDVWVMQEYGVKESWNKRFSITQENVTRNVSLSLIWDFKNGDQILLVGDDFLIYYDVNRKIDRKVMIRWAGSLKGVDSFVPSLVSLHSGTYVQRKTS